MLNALTTRERRLLLGILAILLLGAMVKWWRWQAQQVENAKSADEAEVSQIESDHGQGLPSGVSTIGGEFPAVTA